MDERRKSTFLQSEKLLVSWSEAGVESERSGAGVSWSEAGVSGSGVRAELELSWSGNFLVEAELE